jgi:drug/metabolite transporter (DMT)-like permease
VTIVFAALILGERPSALQLAGVALILTGIVIATIRRPPASEPIPPEP